MGFFEFLTGSSKSNKKTCDYQRLATDDRKSESFSSGNGNIDSFYPRSFDDIAGIIDHLLAGKPAIVHLTEVKPTTAQRVIDLLSGAIYVLNGNLCELKKDVYIFTPNGVRVNQ